MTSPFFGFVFNEVDTDPTPPVLADFSIIGLVLASDDANPTVFPLNTCVSFNSGDTTALAALGTGPLYQAVLRINAQLADLEVSAQVIAVRVATARNNDGTENVPGTIANIVGSPSVGTGLYALLKAPQVCNLTPRLIGAPGYTGVLSYGVVAPVITAPGANYTNPVVTFSPAGATATATAGNAGVQATANATVGNPGVQATATAALGSGGTAGQVASIAVGNGGTTYRAAPAVTLTGGGGTGATAHAVLTNGVVTSVVVDAPGTGYTSAPTVTLAAPPTGQVTGLVIGNGGQDYVSAPTVTFTGGGGTGAAAHAVLGTGGAVAQIVVDNPGSGYTAAPSVTLGAPPPGEITGIALTNPGSYPAGTAVTMTIADSNGGPGTGATATVGLQLLANPICVALPAICSSLLAHALVGGPGGSKQDALAWRGTLNSPRLIPQDDWEIVAAGSGTAYIDGAARSLGLAVRTDFKQGGYPFNAWANIPVQGALGLKRVDPFSLVDGATDAQELLAAGIGVTVRGDLSDTSLDDSGFIAVSVNNASSDPLGNLYNKTRGRDFINLALLKSIRNRLGKENITPSDVDAVLNDMAAINIDLMSKNKIIGFKVGFKAADNTVENLRAGRFTVYDNTEEPAPIIRITVNRGLDRDALANELEALASSSPTITN